MSYQINYVDGLKNVAFIQKQTIRRKIYWKLALSFVILFAILYACSFPAVKSFLIPGDDVVTAEAFVSFTDHLRKGMSFTDAGIHFCREIISGAELA